MKYFIKQKVFSWKDRFTIKDESGNDVYFVEGEVFSLGKKLRMYDNHDQEILYIEQKFWRMLPEFDLFLGNKQVATVKKEFHLFKNNYLIYGPDWKVDGNFWAHDYVIRERGGVIADITKQWLTWGDAYEINIFDESQADILLGIVIVIDCVLAAANNSAANSST